MKLDVSKVDLTDNNQKIIAGVLILLVITGLWFLLPPLVFFLKNLWLAVILGLPVLYAVLNPMVVWNTAKQVSWNLTKKLISGDKLGYMYRYHDYLEMKRKGLDESITRITAAKIKLARSISDLQNKIESNKKTSVIYQDQGRPETVIRTLANQINADSKRLSALLPRGKAIVAQEQQLINLSQVWKADSDDLKYTLDGKAEEYKLLKELNEATGNASEFLKGNSEEYKIFQESLVQIEEQVSIYTANLEDFERKARPLLDNASADRTISEDEGLKLIEEFKKGSVELKIA